MDMKKILQNMDAAAVGNKPFKGDENYNDMKKILEGLNKVNQQPTKQVINESASMNISMTADDASQVGELMALMRNAGMNPQPVGNAFIDNPNIPGRDDVPGDQDLKAGALGSAVGAGLGAMAGGPIGAAVGGGIGSALTSDDHDDPNIPGKDDVPGDQDLQAGMGGSLAGGLLGGAAGQVAGAPASAALGAAGTALGTAVGGPVGGAIGGAAGRAIPALAGSVVGSKIGDKLTGEDYENEPDEDYRPASDMVRGGNDINKSKKSYPPVAGGDNPMAIKDKIKEELSALYKQFQNK